MGPHSIATLSEGDPATKLVLDSLRRIVQVLRTASRSTERDIGISAAQLFVLQRLAIEPSLSVNDLAARTLTHQSSVSVVVQRLVDQGLVVRTTSSEDARRVAVSITAKGRALLRRAPGAAQDRLIAGLQRLTSVERRDLAKGLGRLLNAMGESEPNPPMFFEESSPRTKRRRSR